MGRYAIQALVWGLLFFLPLPCLGEESYEKNGDFHLWLEETFRHQLTPKNAFYLCFEERYGQGASQLYQWYFQPGFQVLVTPFLEVAPGYRQTYVFDEANREWRTTYTPLLDLTYRGCFCGWPFFNRNRFFMIYTDRGALLFEYRNRLEVEAPRWAGITPYASEEVFFRERVGFWQYRLIMGGRIALVGRSTLRGYYMLQEMKFEEGRRWRHYNTLGLRLQIDY